MRTVGATGLVDYYNCPRSSWTFNCLLVYQARRTAPFCCSFPRGYERFIQCLGYCKLVPHRFNPSHINHSQCDDLILRKVNESDASVFAQRYGGSSQCWGVFWCIISLAFMACGIVAGLAAFPESFQEQEDDSKKFIPTR